MQTDVEVRDGFVTLSGLRFHYRDWGSEDASPLVLLHGNSGQARGWDRFAAAMADRRRVLALDQRGRGETAWAQDYTAAALAEDLAAFLRALGLTRAAILGHSMGAGVAYLHAVRHPESFERLVIVDIGPDSTAFIRALRADFDRSGRDGRPPVALDWEEARRLLATYPPATFIDSEDAVKAAGGGLTFAAEQAEELRLRALANLIRRDDGAWTWRYDPLITPANVNALPVPEDWAAMATLRCPTLVVRGADSPVLTRETAERMARTIPDCRLAEVPDSGHEAPFENFAGFLAVVRPFLL
jgi:pimeloyl-ACP methyl ester carboxylesterase